MVHILPCTRSCTNAFQDAAYGPGMRVWNGAGTVQNPKRRCTVCATVVLENRQKGV